MLHVVYTLNIMNVYQKIPYIASLVLVVIWLEIACSKRWEYLIQGECTQHPFNTSKLAIDWVWGPGIIPIEKNYGQYERRHMDM